MRYIVICSILLGHLGLLGQQQIELQPALKSIVAYSSSAELNYQDKVGLKTGRTSIEFKNLSPFIVENSINFSVSDPNVKIVSVTEKLDFIEETPYIEQEEQSKKLEVLNREKKLSEAKLSVLKGEQGLLFKDESIGGLTNGVPVQEIEKASAFYNRRMGELNVQILELEEELASLNADIKNIGLQMIEDGLKEDVPTSSITIVLECTASKNIDVQLRFLCNNAGWAPLYDINYLGVDSDLKIVFRANLFNATNTDWENVDVKLSTANPSVGFSLPSLSDEPESEKTDISYKGENIKFKTVEASSIIAEFEIKFKCDIPSTGRPYLFDVDEFKAPAQFSYIAIPKIDNRGFLMANIPNWSSFNLLSGTTNIYNQGTYLGKTFLRTLTENDTLQVYLGKDNNIKIFRKENTKEYTRKAVGNYYVDKTSINISMKNMNNASVSILVIDQVPDVFKDEDIKLSVNGIDDGFINRATGEVQWNIELGSGATKDMQFAYSLKYAKELDERVKSRSTKFRPIACPAF